MVFVRIYDALVDSALSPVELNDWAATDAHITAATRVRDQVITHGRLSTAATRPTTFRKMFALAAGLHDALRRADPRASSEVAPALAVLRARACANVNLLPDDEQGALVARRTYPNRPESAPTTVADLFPALLRVPHADWKNMCIRVVPPFTDLSNRGKTLPVATVPVLASGSDVHVESLLRAGVAYYRVKPITRSVRRRVSKALAALDASGAEVGVIPEATLNNTLLQQWQKACLDTKTSGRLRWVLVGTGPVTATARGMANSRRIRDGSELTSNRAVLLDRRTGENLLVQDKQHGFSMDAGYLSRVPELRNILGPGPVNEFLPKAPGLNVLETDSGRFAVLVCEDLDRIDVVASALSIGVSHVLAPVFAPPMQGNKWQANASQHLLSEGIAVLVANSLALGRQALFKSGKPSGPANTLLIFSPANCGPHILWSAIERRTVPRRDRLAAEGQTLEDDVLTARTGKMMRC